MNKILTNFFKRSFSISKNIQKGRALDLPIIDLSALTANKDFDQKILLSKSHEIHAACSEYGAFLVRNTTINSDESLRNIKKFFDLPQPEKDKIKIEKGGFSRGYIGIGDESGSDSFEVKEAFSYGYDWNANVKPLNSMQGPNVWPSHVEAMKGWEKEMNNFFNDF